MPHLRFHNFVIFMEIFTKSRLVHFKIYFRLIWAPHEWNYIEKSYLQDNSPFSAFHCVLVGLSCRTSLYSDVPHKILFNQDPYLFQIKTIATMATKTASSPLTLEEKQWDHGPRPHSTTFSPRWVCEDQGCRARRRRLGGWRGEAARPRQAPRWQPAKP